MPANALLACLQRIAQVNPDAIEYIAERLQVDGRKVDATKAPQDGAARDLELLEELLENDSGVESSFGSLGSVLSSHKVVTYLINMPTEDMQMPDDDGKDKKLEEDSLVQHAILALAHHYSDKAEVADDYSLEDPLYRDMSERQQSGRPIDQAQDSVNHAGSSSLVNAPLLGADMRTSSTMPQSAQTPMDVKDSGESNLTMPMQESAWVKLAALYIMVALLAHLVARLYDIVDAEGRENNSWHVFYRVIVLLVEIGYASSAVESTVARSRRQRIEQLRDKGHGGSPFTVKQLLTLLTVTDESTNTIVASVRAHVEAAKVVTLGHQIVLVTEATKSAAVIAAAEALKNEVPRLLVFTKEELAKQEYLRAGSNPENAQVPLNVVLEENMALGQVVFYALHRLFLQYGVEISYSAITIMEASSIPDTEKYYPYVIEHLQQPGMAVVSTPTYVRNHAVRADLVDITQFERERVYLTGVAADDKLAINPMSFTARGYSLWRALRRMELENIDTSNLYWVTYGMHVEARQATLGVMTQHAPITNTLAPTNAATVLSRVLERQIESYDVAMIFERERNFLSWDVFRPLRAPHDSARGALVMEIVIVVIAIITAAEGLAPWSTTNLWVAATFVALYGGIMISHLLTPYGFVLALAANALRNRILVAPFTWLYFLNLSRFSVDRRGHFKAVGETTTANLVTYKEKQREELEEAAEKAKRDVQAAKERAEQERKEAEETRLREAAEKKDRREQMKEAAKTKKADAQTQKQLDKEREKRRRANRGPGAKYRPTDSVMSSAKSSSAVSESASAEDEDDAPPEIEIVPMATVAEAPDGAPVAEGWFSSGKAGADSDSSGKVSSGSPDRTSKLVSHKFEIPKFTTPKAPSSAYGRTGQGDLFRRHGGIKSLSVPVFILLVVASLGSILGSVLKIIGPDVPANYTIIEILAARSWYISVCLLSVFVLIAQFAYLSFLVRMPKLCANSYCAPVSAIISFILIVLVGVLPFLSWATLDSRNAAYDIDGLHASHMRFLAASGAGEPYTPLAPPWRSASDGGIKHPVTGASLSGGWYTGPGLAKFTYPQAMLVTDLAYASLSQFVHLRDMPSGAPGAGLSAAEDIRDALIHGARYLLACHDPASNTVVSHVYTDLSADPGAEWARPEARTGSANVRLVDAANPGTETFAAITAAFALASVALVPYSSSEEALALSNELGARAEMTYRLMASTHASYEAVHPEVAQFWPSDGANLYDDKLLAAAMMLYATGFNVYKNAVNGYYTFAQQERAARNKLEEYRIDVDDHWWTANSFLANADRLNSRYRDALVPFMNAWMLEEGTVGISDKDGLTWAQPPRWAAGGGSPYITQGPLGMNLRAMSYIALWATSKTDEGSVERDAICFAQGQLRHMMGLNSAKQSYIVGVSPDGSRAPTKATTRLAGTNSIGDGGDNPNVVEGAVVNGPSKSGYRDQRNQPEMNGVSILNNSPLSMLLAALHSRNLNIEDCIGFDPRKHSSATSVLPASSTASELA